ncbi:alpha/beta fold hydrolase [Cognatilysobacter bugurensis]|uniref:Alpha/beta hydrolase n=1 Tax=Cognatilysobacter bugurensis TaxID=543356 RepID=A0A918T2Z9_9GAMM|nr:alpha/beta hydrolase [Lysobacter bugurensis]GHA89091.1 alpha/beta hydrolase [Lysobacter bugurensis]
MRLTPRTIRPALVLALITAASGAHATDRFSDLSVEVVGDGRPVLMIPGLNSAADTWRETCQALQPQVQCHLVQLPGFAGAPAAKHDAFLPAMRAQLVEYVRSRKLAKPAVIGHSLGGVLALQVAVEAPDAVGPLVIVDSLPFFAGVMNPKATAASVEPMAAGMRAQMLAADDATYAKNAEAAVRGMTRDPARTETLKTWGRASERATTSQAMYELMVTDLRPQLSKVKSPTLVLGAWAAYAPMGSTKASTEAIFRTQYAGLDGARIEMSEGGYHFLMWDDPTWLQSNVRDFLAAHPQTN